MRSVLSVTAIGLPGLALLLLYGQTGAAPDERAGMAARAEGVVIARCGSCHSTDLITQQRLNRSQWQGTVGKMVQWGAELSEEEAVLLVEFLATRFHQTAPASVTLNEIGAAEPLQAEPLVIQERPSGISQEGAGVFANNCQGCHGSRARGGFGPKLAGNPILNSERFWQTLLYGRGGMPAWEHTLSRQEIANILAWLKTL